MKNYAIFLHGENFDIQYRGKRQPVGLFTTIRVEAETDEAASQMAVKVLEADPALAEAFLPNASTTPTIQVKVVHVLEPSNKMKNTVHTFFAMSDA